VKISKITNGLFVSLLLTASVASAADSEYPATSFEPKIVYQDTDYKHSGSADSISSSSSKAEVSVADSAYPAANFQPEVLYQDDKYEHKDAKVTAAKASASKSSASSESSSSAAVSASNDSAESVGSSEDSSMDLVLGLGILAIAGFVFYGSSAKGGSSAKKAKKKAKPAAKKVQSRKVFASADGSVSSVSKYLEGKATTEPSGVEKYLEEKNTSVSSVSKYVAKQRISARVASVTGVEKYLKDKG
jgi:hypothetical protein